MFARVVFSSLRCAAAAASGHRTVASMSKKQFYAVIKGRAPGLYSEWKAAKAQVTGFKGAVHKGFKSQEEAMEYLEQHGVDVPMTAGAAGGMHLTPNHVQPASTSGRHFGGAEEQQPWVVQQEQEQQEQQLLLQQQQHQFPWDQQPPHLQQQQQFGTPCHLHQPQQDAVTTATAQQQQQHVAAPNSLGRRMRMEFDGASKSNPGDSGFGAVIYDEASGVEITRLCQYMGPQHTNNQAEWAGLLAGMAAALELGCRDLVVQGDSKLVIQQLLGSYQVKAEGLVPYHALAMLLKQRFGRLEAVHVLRAHNAVADALSNQAIANHYAGLQPRPWTLAEFAEAVAPLVGRKATDEGQGHSAKRRRMAAPE